MSGTSRRDASPGHGAMVVATPLSRLAHARLSLVALGAYALVLAAAMHRVGGSSVSYWLAVLAVMVITVVTIRASRLPLAFYGLTLRGARSSLGAAALSAAALAAAGVGFLLLRAGPAAELLPLRAAASANDAELVAYLLLAVPVQELVFRGVFQSTARHLLGDTPRAAAAAIVISTVAYAASHFPWGLPTALVMLVPGIVWGVQFERDRTLAGVVLSHVVIGYLFVGATPLWKLITGAA